MKRSVAVTLLFAGCFLWACIGISSRALYSAGFSPFQVSATKAGVTAVGIGVILAMSDMSKFAIRRKDISVFLVLGLSKFVADYLIFYGQSTISLSLTAMLQLTSPYYVLIFSAVLFGERITGRKIGCMTIAAVGCILATGVLSGSGNNDISGIIAASCAGVAGGVLAVTSKESLNRGYGPETVLFYMFAVGAAISVFFCDPVWMVEKALEGTDVFVFMLLLGVLFTLIPYFMNLSAMGHMPITHVAVIGLSELIFTALVGLVMFQELPTLSTVVGICMIILSIVLLEESGAQYQGIV